MPERIFPEREEIVVYRILLGIFAALAAAFFVCAGLGIHPMRAFPPCVFRSLTGFYCPGCGIGHAAEALLSFRFAEAFLYHPFFVYAAGFLLIYILANSAGALIRRRRFVFPLKSVYLWIGLALLLGNWILRNVLWLGFGIPIH